jgi:RNA-directed DNA polymerase
MNGSGESSGGIVLTKRSNEGQGGRQEIVEGRPPAKENMGKPNSCRAPNRESEPSGLDGVRQAAKKDKGLRFTTLLHHVDLGQLRGSYFSLKKRAAAGVDEVTWQEYGNGLEERLADLHGRGPLWGPSWGLSGETITTSLDYRPLRR